jgi:hypothetical protein
VIYSQIIAGQADESVRPTAFKNRPLLLAFAQVMSHAEFDLHRPRFISVAVNEAAQVCPKHAGLIGFCGLEMGDALIDIVSCHLEQFLIAFVHHVHVWRFDPLNRDPDLKWDANHDLILGGLEFCFAQFEVNVLIIEDFVVEVKVLAVGQGSFGAHDEPRFLPQCAGVTELFAGLLIVLNRMLTAC